MRTGSAHSFNPITPSVLDSTSYFVTCFLLQASHSSQLHFKCKAIKGDSISAGSEQQKQIPANKKHFGWEVGEKERFAER